LFLKIKVIAALQAQSIYLILLLKKVEITALELKTWVDLQIGASSK